MMPPNAGSLTNSGRMSRSIRVSTRNDQKISARSFAVRERAGEIGDVGVALNPVRAAAVRGAGPLAVPEHFSRGHIPDAGVAEEGGGRRPCLRIGRGGRSRSGGLSESGSRAQETRSGENRRKS